MKAIALTALLLLSGCSGVSLVCDKRGRCLETWRDAGALSNVTHSEMVGPAGERINVEGATVTGSGVVSYIDPLASGLSSTASDARAAAGASW